MFFKAGRVLQRTFDLFDITRNKEREKKGKKMIKTRKKKKKFRDAQSNFQNLENKVTKRPKLRSKYINLMMWLRFHKWLPSNIKI